MAINKGKLASEVLGLGSGGGGLEKLKIEYETKRIGKFTGRIEALFNPEELSFSRQASWKHERLASKGVASDSGVQRFISSDPETLNVQLFFDTYEKSADKLTLGHLKAAVVPTNPFMSSPEATNVKKHTEKLVDLIRVNQELHRPPQCKLKWGEYEFFKGVLTSLNHKFTMFMPDGMPVRATVDCSFVERFTESFARELHSADVPRTRVAQRGDTLQSLAAEEYNDPALWRNIARANKIISPRQQIRPGHVLIIPALRP
ncbi:MAG: CIS tube protein [Gammaproteobacteria bacterium]